MSFYDEEARTLRKRLTETERLLAEERADRQRAANRDLIREALERRGCDRAGANHLARIANSTLSANAALDASTVDAAVDAWLEGDGEPFAAQVPGPQNRAASASDDRAERARIRAERVQHATKHIADALADAMRPGAPIRGTTQRERQAAAHELLARGIVDAFTGATE